MKPWRPFPLHRWRALAAMALAALVASCALSRPAPVKQMFLLETAAPPAAAAPKPVSLRIGAINVAAAYRGKALVFRQGDVKYEADFYSEFFVAPAAMLAEAVAKSLTAANVFRRVIPPGAAPDDADYALDGFAADLYGDLRDPAKPAATLTVTFYLSTANSVVPNVVWSKEYRQRVPAADTGSEAVVRAWNSALATILAELARDLAALPLPKT